MVKSKSGDAATESAFPDVDSVSEGEGTEPAIPDAEVVLKPSPAAAERQESERPYRTEAQPPQQAPRRRGVFVPLVLGGAVAAGIGAGASLYLLPNGWKRDTNFATAIADLKARVDSQDSAIAALPPVADTSAEIGSIKAEIGTFADKHTAISDDLSRLSQQLTGLDTRLTALEQRPAGGDAATTAAAESFRHELDTLKTQIAAQQTLADAAGGDIAKAAEAAAARIKDAETQAARLRSDAEAAARASAAKAAIDHLRTAIDAGTSLQPAIDELTASGVTVPAAITASQAGIPSAAALKSAFVESAREALIVSLKESAPASWTGRVTAFLRAETGARSLVARAGDDPDAVLSRAEAAVDAGDYSQALAEIDKLPSGGKARMADWTRQVHARIELQDAVTALAAMLK